MSIRPYRIEGRKPVGGDNKQVPVNDVFPACLGFRVLRTCGTKARVVRAPATRTKMLA